MLEKCVLTILELNRNQRLGHKKTKLNICHHTLRLSTQLQNRSFHVVERTRMSSKCQKLKNARAKRAKILFFIVKYANLRGFCCRRRYGCLSSLLFNSNGELVERFLIIPNHALCAVGFCDNVKRYPDLAHVRSHVVNFTHQKWSADPKLAEIWLKQVAKT